MGLFKKKSRFWESAQSGKPEGPGIRDRLQGASESFGRSTQRWKERAEQRATSKHEKTMLKLQRRRDETEQRAAIAQARAKAGPSGLQKVGQMFAGSGQRRAQPGGRRKFVTHPQLRRAMKRSHRYAGAPPPSPYGQRQYYPQRGAPAASIAPAPDDSMPDTGMIDCSMPNLGMPSLTGVGTPQSRRRPRQRDYLDELIG